MGILAFSGCFTKDGGTASYHSTDCDVVLNGEEFTWGDGTDTVWLGPYNPGEDICASHTWSLPGYYLLEIMLKNESGQWMISWAGMVYISKKSKEISNRLFLQFLERFSLLSKLLDILVLNKILAI